MSRRHESTAFLLECLADALITLMKEKDYRLITVSEIAKRAGVGRATYFRHVERKEDLIVFKLKVCWERWAEAAGLRMTNGFALENTEAFFRFNYANREWLRLVYDAGLSRILLSTFDVIFAEASLDREQQYADAFFKYGLCGLLNTWIANGFEETPEDMIRIGGNIVRQLVVEETAVKTAGRSRRTAAAG